MMGGRFFGPLTTHHAPLNPITTLLRVNDLTFSDPCIVFALRREAQALLREFPPHQRFPGAPCAARFCGPAWLTILVLEIGMGAEAVDQAAAWLLNQPK